MKNTKNEVSQSKTIVFQEHCILVTDVDSRNVFPAYKLINQKVTESRAINIMESHMNSADVQMLLGGNTGEHEYLGLTGKTIQEEILVVQFAEITDGKNILHTVTTSKQFEVSPRKDEFEFEKLAQHG